MKQEVHIYTDGSVKAYDEKEGGFGGWAFHLMSTRGGWGSDTLQGSGSEEGTTNNRMELTAVLKAVHELPRFARSDTPVRIYSDSEYVVNAFRRGWLKRWEQQGWQNTNGPVKNLDLWMTLKWLVEQHEDIEFIWVRGHDGDHYNEIVDTMAQEAAAALLEKARPGVAEARAEKRRARRRKTFPLRARPRERTQEFL